MTNDKRDSQPPRARRIDLNNFIARRFWVSRLGITEARLRETVKEVGPEVADIKKRLGIKCS